MNYDELKLLRQKHPGWRLLAADHAPLVVGFLNRTYVEPNIRTVAEQELASRLDDYIFHLRQESDDQPFPKAAVVYLRDWADDQRSWLRKYYPPNVDEPHYDLTPATEKAIRWLVSLQEQHFVGAESRLMTVFDLLRQIVEGAESDPDVRVAELTRRRDALDEEIRETRAGRIELMDDTRLRERFLQMSETASTLLADFRQVEQNFRDLDRQVREKVATWEGSKGQVLEDVFGAQDAIADSDQGRSFRAFWDFLMSPTRQEELSELLQRVFALQPVQELAPDRRLLHIHHDWLHAGETTQRTVARLSEQLRRYLDDQAWLENRRIMSLIRELEQHALVLRDSPPADSLPTVGKPAPDLELPMERPLYRIPITPRIEQCVLVEGDDSLSADALFEQVYVDKITLQAQIRRALQGRSQISLTELLSEHPLQQGLSELVAYLTLAADDEHALIDDRHEQLVDWIDGAGWHRRCSVPTVVFSK